MPAPDPALRHSGAHVQVAAAFRRAKLAILDKLDEGPAPDFSLGWIGTVDTPQIGFTTDPSASVRGDKAHLHHPVDTVDRARMGIEKLKLVGVLSQTGPGGGQFAVLTLLGQKALYVLRVIAGSGQIADTQRIGLELLIPGIAG